MGLTEEDVQAAWDEAERRRRNQALPPADTHGLIQEFGAAGSELETPAVAIMVVTKRCRLVSWSLDAVTPGSCTISLQHSVWVMPRNFTNMVPGTSLAPNLSSQQNNEGTCDGWLPPYLERKDAILITVDSASGVDSITLALYVRELPRSLIRPNPPVTP